MGTGDLWTSTGSDRASQNVERADLILPLGARSTPTVASVERRTTDGDGGDRWAASWIYSDISDNMRAGSCPGAGNLSTMEVSKSNAGLLNPLFQATQLGGEAI